AQIQAQEGDARAAAATARRIDELPRTAIEHYNAACFLSLIVPAIRDSSAPEADRTATAESLADRPMAHLRRALDLGYRNTPPIAPDADLDSLRDRDDFRLLLLDLAFPDDPFERGR